ncbi:flagellar basal body L-ring protein FlgH [Falsiroseomonas selenitidurans]|uniref:Flagellar L-ring protein n=1 Tax=Falsiroseomonas selenitidurans TaxID=2716335 RepID=A0ABX1E3E4_9PROT|nr:flagellar basal body L-ring protein FlgH [Falsiroseomonas selenitidurans]NKC31694.1 flagellar basal body L-ring protein FlgH [Falsiroseomonas selenitidurans]
MMRPAPLLLVLLLAGCGTAQRLSEVGRAPSMAPIESPDLRPISMPMPTAQVAPPEANSLWRPGSRTFLRDQRAAQVGDLVTVLVQITDQANLQNSTQRTRANTESLGLPRLLGLESSYGRLLPNGIDPSQLLSGASDSASQGGGAIQRTETITLRVAATVTQTLPNGNLVVAGRQQVRVNQELRDMQVSGIIRPQDIASDNTVKHDRLAEARIAYGGRGTVSDVQAPRYGQQLLDIILPF